MEFISLVEKYDIGQLNIIGWKSDYSKNVIYHELLDRKEMISEMLNISVDLIPFKKHPFHYFISPNKAYEYAHAGLLILSTDSIKSIFDELKDNVVGFEDYDEMIHQLEYFKAKPEEVFSKRLKTFEFARRYILWENYEESIFEAYNVA
jgi:glycosyltransferase involved in cell wall biosynthesis